MDIERIPVEMNAARVCDAIAKIGYSPASALMDIVDNSVTAGASRVEIRLVLDPEKTYGERSNIREYLVADNGSGMNDDDILNALRLGSRADYPVNSLSKYGMGLKSAGFSLGRRIEVISRKIGVFAQVHYVDRTEIAEAYFVNRRPATEDEIRQAESLMGNADHGTVIRITGCESIVHQSAATTVKKLSGELGVTYHDFIQRKVNPLELTLSCTNKPSVKIQPLDILFLEDAISSFDPDSYDCKHPVLVVSTKLGLLPDETKNPELTVVIFPQDSMKDHAGFSEEERKRIREYSVSRKNKGFFIYRNDRLIKWGDDLGGLVGKDELLFRARLALTTDHDDVMHVDVSKQRLEIPEDVSGLIEKQIQHAKWIAKQVADLCKNLPKPPEGEVFNARNETLVPEDPEAPSTEAPKEEARNRRKELVESTKQVLDDAGESSEQPSEGIEAGAQVIPFERVRYSDKVKAGDLWAAHYDPADGVFVRINKNHSFYDTVLSKLAEDSPERQAIEAMLWTFAAAEIKALENLAELEFKEIKEVLRKFKVVVGATLESWCSRNQDLFDGN